MTGMHFDPDHENRLNLSFRPVSREFFESMRLLSESISRLNLDSYSEASRQTTHLNSPSLLWLPSQAVEEISPEGQTDGLSEMFRIKRLIEWSHGEQLLGTDSFPRADYASCVSDTNLASYLGGMITAFPTQPYGFEAAQAISRLDDSLLPLLVAIVLSRSENDWPQEEVLPLLQSVDSVSSTRMLEELALDCVLPHVRVPAILAIAERDNARAERVKERVWGSMDEGTREWLDEDLAAVREPKASGEALDSSNSLLERLRIPLPSDAIVPSEDMTRFRRAVLGAAFQPTGATFNTHAFTEHLTRFAEPNVIAELREALSFTGAEIALRPLERVETQSGETLVRAASER